MILTSESPAGLISLQQEIERLANDRVEDFTRLLIKSLAETEIRNAGYRARSKSPVNSEYETTLRDYVIAKRQMRWTERNLRDSRMDTKINIIQSKCNLSYLIARVAQLKIKLKELRGM